LKYQVNAMTEGDEMKAAMHAGLAALHIAGL
jgi:hypothetical protein